MARRQLVNSLALALVVVAAVHGGVDAGLWLPLLLLTVPLLAGRYVGDAKLVAVVARARWTARRRAPRRSSRPGATPLRSLLERSALCGRAPPPRTRAA